MPTDNLSRFSDSPSSPARACFAVTPSDSGELAVVTKALYVGTGGDLVIMPVDGTDPVTFRNLPDGGMLDVRVRAVRATGTTATDLVGLA
ncbi:MAG: hypothetical protein RIQ46_1841 [Pseudomonadota bacterium]